MPVKRALDAYECRHGLGYTHDHRASATASRPRCCSSCRWARTAEVHRSRCATRADSAKRLQLFSFVEFCLWNALDDMTNFQRNFSTGEVEIEGSVIYHKTEYRERRNHFAFYGVNAPVAGFDTDREIVRRARTTGLHEPECRPGRAIRGTPWRAAGRPIASHCLDVALAPGKRETSCSSWATSKTRPEEKWEAPGVINKRAARALMARFNAASRWTRRSTRFASTGTGCSSRYEVESPDERLNRMVNIWNQYQCMVTFNMSRSASLLRDRHRPRHGLPRLQPGPARLRAPGARARPRAPPRHRLHAASGRQRLPPVPAAHQAGQRRRRQRLQRRSAVAHPRRGRLPQGDGRLGDPATSRSRSTTTRRDAAPLLEHLRRSFAPRGRTTSGRTGCR